MATPPVKPNASEELTALNRIAVAIENNTKVLERLIKAIDHGKRAENSPISHPHDPSEVFYR
jgi:hypothetical protein